MPAQAQSAQAQAAKPQFDAAFEEQQRLRATMTPEEFEADRMLKVERLLSTCKELSKEAERNGLTEEILASILAEK